MDTDDTSTAALAAALNPNVPAEAIDNAELQRQLGEATSINSILRNRLTLAAEVIAVREAEIRQLRDDAGVEASP